MTTPAPQTEIGSLHWLKNRGTRAQFEWTGKGWSSPGTGWQTKSSFMAVLGWLYERPVEDDETKKGGAA